MRFGEVVSVWERFLRLGEVGRMGEVRQCWVKLGEVDLRWFELF